MAFRDVRFPESISYGSTGGPQFNTTILELTSGHEKRNINWSDVRALYNVAYGIKSREEMEQVQHFFMAMLGKAYSFRFKDWMDFDVENLTFTGDGTNTEFQLYKRYQTGPYFYDRAITKPVPGTVGPVTVNGVLYPEDDSGSQANGTFRVDYTTGKMTIRPAPANGAVILIGAFEFDVHCRFDTDHFNPAHEFWETMSWPDIPVIEVKERNA